MGPFIRTKNKKTDFEENKFNERFGRFGFINIESHMYKLIKIERTLMILIHK